MRHQHWTKVARHHRIKVAVALVALSFVLAKGGRWLLDQAALAAPGWAGAIERIGGWLLGLFIVVVVLLPLFYVWDQIKPK